MSRGTRGKRRRQNPFMRQRPELTITINDGFNVVEHRTDLRAFRQMALPDIHLSHVVEDLESELAKRNPYRVHQANTT